LHFFKIDAVFSILDRLLLIAICGALLLYSSEQSPFQLEWFVWSQTAAYGCTFLAAFAILIQKIGMPKFRLQWMFSLAILKKSYPYALLVVLMTLYTRMDAVLLERWHPNGAFQAGIYAQGYRLLDAVFMFGMIFAGLLLPIFSRLLKTNPSGINEIMQTSRNVLVGGALLLASIATFNAEYLLSLIYTNDTQLSSPTFVWLMWSFVAMAFSLLYGTLLTAKGNLRYLNQLALIGIALNLVFNALLIPIYGATGSAFATFSTQAFTALFQTIHCHRKLPISFSISDFFRLVLFIFLLLLIGWLLKGTTTTLYIQLIVGVLLLFVLKLVHHKDLLSVLSSKEEEMLN
jgi:O-antigen/teichoic acid export membrane protein